MFGSSIPTGLSITNSGSAVRVVMPDVGSPGTCSVTYCVQAAANGTTLPVNVDSNSISWREPTSFRNAIINGACGINQRAVDVLQISNLYQLDRWAGYSTNTAHDTDYTVRLSKTVDAPVTVPASKCIAVISQNSANVGTIGLGQKIESSQANALRNSSGKVTASFWIKRTSSVGTGAKLVATMGHPSTEDSWGTGFLRDNTDEIQIIDTFGNLPLNTWVQKTATFTWITNYAIGASLYIAVGHNLDGLGSGRPALVQNAEVFRITGIQLEPGTIATPFEFRPYGTELALCKRYCEVFSPTTGIPQFPAPIDTVNRAEMNIMYSEKRIAPAITVSASNHFLVEYWTGTAMAADTSITYVGTLIGTTTTNANLFWNDCTCGVGCTAVLSTNSASARIYIEAEL
jgi:hypothetical protein